MITKLLSYNERTFSWTSRQLDGISGNGNTVSYKYNAEGIRTEKAVNGVTTKYFIEGDRIVLEKVGNEERAFWYDGDGNAAAFVIYDSTGKHPYYYMRNGQGDIIGLFDVTGSVVARYTYDSWGKLVSITDGNGNDKTNDTSFVGYKNPLRYRGYYYDNETGLYYLQSRYYNPEWGRFLNADIYTNTEQGLISTNMYAYSYNNPVNLVDPEGTCPYCGNSYYNPTNMSPSAYKQHVASVVPNRQKEVEKTLEDNKAYLDQCWIAKGDFYFLVKDRGDWDYKINPPSWLPEGGYFIFNGEVMDAESFGNYNYGYMGAYLNFTPTTILAAGGIVAIKHNGVRWEYSDYYFDDPNDNYWVKKGYLDYKLDHPSSLSWFNFNR